METVLGKIGPIIVSLNSHLLESYTGGIINDTNCPNNLNYYALAVGYNKTGGYYLVKNRYYYSFISKININKNYKIFNES